MQKFELTRGESRYLSSMLEKVSRSFALVIPTLEEPFNYYMATAYLICRVVDNIEDCTQESTWKEHRFQELQQLIHDDLPSARPILARWGEEPWPGLTGAEREMMGDPGGLPLWEIYAKIPGWERASIGRWVSEMADGMVRIIGAGETGVIQDEHDGIRVLADEPDYNTYCFYVAGTVGHLASELAVAHYGLSDEVAQKLDASCEACGRGLQKTNILKDFVEDLARGISYLPYTWHQQADCTPLRLAGAPAVWTRKVIGDVVGELQDATSYVLALPYDATGYRMASLISLLSAYQTVLLAARKRSSLFTREHHVRISRPAMAKCQWDARSLLNNNRAVREYSDRVAHEIEFELG